MNNSIAELPSDCNYDQPVISYRFIPINWLDGTTSQIALVDGPRRQPQELEDRPIIIGGLVSDIEEAVGA